MDLNRTNVILDRVARNKENENWAMIEGSTQKMKDDFNNTVQKLEGDIKNVVDNISEQVVDQLVDTAKLDWKEPVGTYSDLPKNPEIGETRQVRDTGKVYRFDGVNWVEIQEYDASAINEVDSRLTAKIAEKAEKEDLVTTNQKVDNVTQNLNDINKKVYDFDFTSLSPSFYTSLTLEEGTIMQSFVINDKTKEIYATQVTSSPEGHSSHSYRLNRLTIDGKLIDSMKLVHGGHGVGLAIENTADGVYVWSDYDIVDGAGNTMGHDLVRFKYKPGVEYDETSPALERFDKFTKKNATPAVDEKNKLIAFRVGSGSDQTVIIRNLDDVKSGVDNVLAALRIPPDLTYLQGFTIDGYDLYWYTGDTNSVEYPNEITLFDLQTGVIKKRVTVDFGYGLDGKYEDGVREPEGIYLFTDKNTGTKSLFCGVITGEIGRRNNKIYSYHALGNDSKFNGNKTQSMQMFQLTENNGWSKKFPSNLTKISDLTTPGDYYMATADTGRVSDHPFPGIAGWHLEVSPAAWKGVVYQILRRNSTADVNATVLYRTVSGGNSSSWFRLVTQETKQPVFPTLANNWQNFYADESRLNYFKVGLSQVSISGVIKRDAGPTSSHIFQLPSDLRPVSRQAFVIRTSNGAAELFVNTNGYVSIPSLVIGENPNYFYVNVIFAL